MKKAVFISAFNYYDNRIVYMEKKIRERGYETIYITSNFDHISKKEFHQDGLNVLQISVPKYSKNISIKRIYSHFIFSWKVYLTIRKLKPNFIFCMIPPNFLSKFISLFKKKYKKTKVVFDIYDLWPETLPIDSIKNNKILATLLLLWAKLRNDSLKSADLITVECAYFAKELMFKQNKLPYKEIYLTQKGDSSYYKSNDLEEVLNIAYLGSINNIIDIDNIVDLLEKLNSLKKVELKLIGEGEKKKELLNLLDTKNISYKNYGVIYEEKIKKDILGKCDFAINIMKPSVKIGLTMKSIDYLRYGLPLLNNIPGDTYELVENYEIGFNININDLNNEVVKISNMTPTEINNMKKNSNQVFDNMFSNIAFESRIEKIYDLLKL